jgi:hypothetical protein
LTLELVRPFPKTAGRKGTANSARNKRYTEILTDTPVKAALRDTQKSRGVAKGKTYQKGTKRCLLIALKEILRRRGNSQENSDCSEENVGETFCLVSMDTYWNIVAGEIRVQCTHCQMWAHEKCTSGVSWGYICPNCKLDVSDENF